MLIELLTKMNSYFLGLRNLLCRSLGLKFEANHFLGTGKISDDDPYPRFTRVALRIEDIKNSSACYAYQNATGRTSPGKGVEKSAQKAQYYL